MSVVEEKKVKRNAISRIKRTSIKIIYKRLVISEVVVFKGTVNDTALP